MRTSQVTKVIGEGHSTETRWTLLTDGKVELQATTGGLNPFFLSRREISHCIRLELPKEFFRRRWHHVYFYGAGCSTEEKKKVVESSLVAQFKTPVTVESDLVGAARGSLINEPGLACILGTGSNSCFYDGKKIAKNVNSLGFILGDEGSGASIGRIFLGDLLKGLAPQHVAEMFQDEVGQTTEEIMDAVYSNPYAARNLRNYATFLVDHIDDEYVYNLMRQEIARFFERNICQYEDYRNHPICFVGSVATHCSEILLSVAHDYEAKVRKILNNSMQGLIIYHGQDDLED